LGVQHDGERVGRAVLSNGHLGLVQRKSGRVVIHILERQVCGVSAAVFCIRADGGCGDDLEPDIAVVQPVVDTGDRHRLRFMPVGRVERQSGRRNGAFGRVAAADTNLHGAGRLAGQPHRKRGDRLSILGHVAADRRHLDPRRVVVIPVHDGHRRGMDAVVFRIGSGRSADNREGNVVVVDLIVDTGNRDRTRRLPIALGRSKRDAGRRDGSLRRIAADELNGHVHGRRSSQRDRERCRSARFGHIAADRGDEEPRRVVVHVRHGHRQRLVHRLAIAVGAAHGDFVAGVRFEVQIRPRGDHQLVAVDFESAAGIVQQRIGKRLVGVRVLGRQQSDQGAARTVLRHAVRRQCDIRRRMVRQTDLHHGLVSGQFQFPVPHVVGRDAVEGIRVPISPRVSGGRLGRILQPGLTRSAVDRNVDVVAADSRTVRSVLSAPTDVELGRIHRCGKRVHGAARPIRVDCVDHHGRIDRFVEVENDPGFVFDSCARRQGCNRLDEVADMPLATARAVVRRQDANVPVHRQPARLRIPRDHLRAEFARIAIECQADIDHRVNPLGPQVDTSVVIAQSRRYLHQMIAKREIHQLKRIQIEIRVQRVRDHHLLRRRCSRRFVLESDRVGKRDIWLNEAVLAVANG